MATSAAQLQGSTAIGSTVPPPPPPVVVQTPDAPAKVISSQALTQIAFELTRLFTQYSADRLLQEQKFIKNLRQYLGIYDPEIEKALEPNQSRAYPRLTRVKCISMLARIMNMMFPGNEKNWELNASPSAEMNPLDVKAAVQALMQEKATANNGQAPPMSMDLINEAVNRLAKQRARDLEKLIDDQLMEIGGDQTLDYISLV